MAGVFWLQIVSDEFYVRKSMKFERSLVTLFSSFAQLKRFFSQVVYHQI